MTFDVWTQAGSETHQLDFDEKRVLSSREV